MLVFLHMHALNIYIIFVNKNRTYFRKNFKKIRTK